MTAAFVIMFSVILLARVAINEGEYWDNARFLYIYVFLWLIIAHIVNALRFGLGFGELRLLFGRISFGVITFTTYYLVRNLHDYCKILRIFCYSVLVFSVIIVLASLLNIDPFGVMTKNPRVYWGKSMIFNKTTFLVISDGELGIIFVSAIPILIYSINRSVKLLSTRFAAFSMGLILFATFITQSRNVWLTVTTTLVALFSLQMAKISPKYLKACVVLTVVSCTVVVTFLFRDVLVLVIEGFTGTGVLRENVFNRFEFYIIGLRLFLNNMVLGVGSSNIMHYTGIHRTKEVVLHNAFVDQMAGTGLVGFIPFLLLFLLAFFQLFKALRSSDTDIAMYARLLLASMAGSFCALQFYRGFFPETLAVELGLVMALWDFYRYDLFIKKTQLSASKTGIIECLR
jgi:O-antigen ligase